LKTNVTLPTGRVESMHPRKYGFHAARRIAVHRLYAGEERCYCRRERSVVRNPLFRRIIGWAVMQLEVLVRRLSSHHHTFI
jgi:hypothetical protein